MFERDIGGDIDRGALVGDEKHDRVCTSWGTMRLEA
jgi:hypothetical protein